MKRRRQQPQDCVTRILAKRRRRANNNGLGGRSEIHSRFALIANRLKCVPVGSLAAANNGKSSSRCASCHAIPGREILAAAMRRVRGPSASAVVVVAVERHWLLVVIGRRRVVLIL